MKHKFQALCLRHTIGTLNKSQTARNRPKSSCIISSFYDKNYHLFYEPFPYIKRQFFLSILSNSLKPCLKTNGHSNFLNGLSHTDTLSFIYNHHRKNLNFLKAYFCSNTDGNNNFDLSIGSKTESSINFAYNYNKLFFRYSIFLSTKKIYNVPTCYFFQFYHKYFQQIKFIDDFQFCASDTFTGTEDFPQGGLKKENPSRRNGTRTLGFSTHMLPVVSNTNACINSKATVGKESKIHRTLEMQAKYITEGPYGPCYKLKKDRRFRPWFKSFSVANRKSNIQRQKFYNWSLKVLTSSTFASTYNFNSLRKYQGHTNSVFNFKDLRAIKQKDTREPQPLVQMLAFVPRIWKNVTQMLALGKKHQVRRRSDSIKDSSMIPCTGSSFFNIFKEILFLFFKYYLISKKEYRYILETTQSNSNYSKNGRNTHKYLTYRKQFLNVFRKEFFLLSSLFFVPLSDDASNIRTNSPTLYPVGENISLKTNPSTWAGPLTEVPIVIMLKKCPVPTEFISLLWPYLSVAPNFNAQERVLKKATRWNEDASNVYFKIRSFSLKNFSIVPLTLTETNACAKYQNVPPLRKTEILPVPYDNEHAIQRGLNVGKTKCKDTQKASSDTRMASAPNFFNCTTTSISLTQFLSNLVRLLNDKALIFYIKNLSYHTSLKYLTSYWVYLYNSYMFSTSTHKMHAQARENIKNQKCNEEKFLYAKILKKNASKEERMKHVISNYFTWCKFSSTCTGGITSINTSVGTKTKNAVGIEPHTWNANKKNGQILEAQGNIKKIHTKLITYLKNKALFQYLYVNKSVLSFSKSKNLHQLKINQALDKNFMLFNIRQNTFSWLYKPTTPTRTKAPYYNNNKTKYKDRRNASTCSAICTRDRHENLFLQTRKCKL
jgi:hypothetical protein